PTAGESSADTWYEIAMTATDKFGLSTTKSVNIHPQKVNINFATDPPGLQITAAGIPHQTPETISAVAGYNLDVSAPNQELGGIAYELDHWSDGSLAEHAF